MTELNLEWIEAGRLLTRRIGLNPVSKQAGVTRIGRDPSRCDIVLGDGSVSGLHVEIGYDSSTQWFYIQNLRESNPPIINSQPLLQGRRSLLPENIIQLGNVQIRANLIAETPLPLNQIPETELQSLGSMSTPLASDQTAPPAYPPPNSPEYFQPRAGEFPLSAAPETGHIGSSETHDSGFDHSHPSPNLADVSPPPPAGSKSPLLFLGLGGILLGLFFLAWPNIRGFLGIGASTIDSSQTTEPVDRSDLGGDVFSISDRELFIHPSNLFELEIPRDWLEIDNSRTGQVVIQAWHHPSVNAYIIMRIFSTETALSSSELQLFSQQLVDDLFSNLDRFQRTAPEVLGDGRVRIFWEGDQGRDALTASTFVRQDGLNLSALTLWAPIDLIQSNSLQGDVDEILASWNVNPDLEIP